MIEKRRNRINPAFLHFYHNLYSRQKVFMAHIRYINEICGKATPSRTDALAKIASHNLPSFSLFSFVGYVEYEQITPLSNRNGASTARRIRRIPTGFQTSQHKILRLGEECEHKVLASHASRNEVFFFITDSGCRSLTQSRRDFPFWGWILLFSDLSRTGRGSVIG